MATNVVRGALYGVGNSLSRVKWRWSQLEIQQPAPIRAIQVIYADGAGLAVGDSTASAVGLSSSQCAFQRTAFQTDTFQVCPEWPIANYYWTIEQRVTPRAVKLGRGAQVEFKQPTPLAILSNQDTVGAASGDAIASGSLNALGDFAGAASGDAVASGSLTALGDFAGDASGDAIASGTLAALADQSGSASGDAIASGEGASNIFAFPVWDELLQRRGPDRAVKLGRGAQIEFSTPLPLTIPAVGGDGSGSAVGDAVASGELTALADFAGAASGDAIASAEGAFDAVVDGTGTAIGDATCRGFIEDATPVVVVPPAEGQAPGGAGAVGAWNAWYKSTQRRKKRKKVEEPIVVEAAIAAKEEADDRLSALMQERDVLLAHISELEFARYRAAAQADVKRAVAELALARELEDEDEAIVWLMAA